MSVIENTVNNSRNKLEQVIPLKTPYCILIEPSNLCNFKCYFCAMQSSATTKNISKQCMTFEMFKKIIDDIECFDKKIKMIRLAGTGEPLINKDLSKMIKYAKQRNVADCIEIITNASLLNPKLSDELIDSGIDRIKISIEALDKEGYKKISKVDVDFEKILKNIKYLYNNKKQCEIYIKTVDEAIDSKDDQEKFYKLFGDKCDKIFIENITPLWADFDDLAIKNSVGLYGKKLKM